MSTHDVSPIPTPPDSSEPGGDALREAWGEALRSEAKAELLLGRVRALQQESERQSRALEAIYGATGLISTAQRPERLGESLLDLLDLLLGTTTGILWLLEGAQFEARIRRHVPRPLTLSLSLPAPHPFPSVPLALGLCQWLEPQCLPLSLKQAIEGMGPEVHFVPLEYQGLLLGFGLLVWDGPRTLDPITQDALDILLRLFSEGLHRAWTQEDLKQRRVASEIECEALRARVDALARENRALAQGQGFRIDFLSFAAGELRHLFGQILGLMARLQREVQLSTEERSLLLMEGMLQGKRMAELLRDLSEMARSSQPQDPGPALPLDLEAVLADIRPLVEGFPATNLKALDWPECQGLPEVLASREALRQVLLCVCHGAIHCSPTGGLHLWVEREALSLTVRMLLEGYDLSPDLATQRSSGSVHPSELYVRAKDGPGLGLVIAEHLMKAMGGTLRLDRDFFGQGTVVTLELPLA